jgi:hypothetical protein
MRFQFLLQLRQAGGGGGLLGIGRSSSWAINWR